ncbi:MAG TPA: acyl-CoA synthetase [Acidimicrobiales bacterium]|nr:acyl-CoA synthetase [Acidimicrobiales bacterium]
MSRTFNLADLFELVVDTVPDDEALVCGERRFTYAQLDERANRLAHVLTERGVAAGDMVGVHLYNGTEYLETMLAAFKIRAVPVNVNYRYRQAELRYLFDDAGVTAVVTEADLATDVREALDGGPRAVTVLERGDAYEAALRAASPARDFGDRSPDDLYVLYTGGTTGMPKGVLWRQEDIFFAALGGAAGGTELARPADLVERVTARGARCLPACPFMHGTAHWLAFSTFFTGGTVVVSPDRHLDAGALWQLVDDERVASLVIVGDAFARPLVDALAAAPDRWDLSALSVILSGGAILSPVLKATLLELLPAVIVVDGFGASETGGQGQMVATPGVSGDHPRFTMNSETTVLDDELRPVAPGSGVVGHLARRGRIPLGYHNDPAKTAATFPVVDGVRWAVPGDMATIEADGTITVLGRGSVSINTGGEKVYPEEVESALKAHDDVFDAVVVGVPDDRWGERVAAVVAPRDPASPPSLETLAAHVNRTLAGYKVPRELVLVHEIVRSPSGKPDYRWAQRTAGDAIAAAG